MLKSEIIYFQQIIYKKSEKCNWRLKLNLAINVRSFCALIEIYLLIPLGMLIIPCTNIYSSIRIIFSFELLDVQQSCQTEKQLFCKCVRGTAGKRDNVTKWDGGGGEGREPQKCPDFYGSKFFYRRGHKIKNIEILKCSKVPLVGTLNLCLEMPDSMGEVLVQLDHPLWRKCPKCTKNL